MCDPTLEQIGTGRIIAILRGDLRGLELEIGAVLYESGITAIEVTMNSPNAFGAIKRLSTEMGQKLAIGVGTVMSLDGVERAAANGARFIVSPNRNHSVIAATKRYEMISIPGCFTPSEICEALDAGADAIKIFPAISVGPRFVHAIRGPLDEIRMIPTGGVTLGSVGEYLTAGAWAVGVGSELISRDVLAFGGLVRLRAKASAFVKAVQTEWR